MVTARLVLQRLVPLVAVWALLVLAAVTCSGCVATDVLDGDIEDPDSCCLYYPSEEKIVRCVESFLPPEPDACVPVSCGIGYVVEGTVCYGDSERRTWER